MGIVFTFIRPDPPALSNPPFCCSRSFRDLIMRELDEGASSVETAQAIMQQHFQPQGQGPNRSGASDGLKLAVLVDWAREAGIETGPKDSLRMGGPELAQVLHNMAQWLFNT